METTNETCKTTSLREEIESLLEELPMDDWDNGYNAAIRYVLEILDKHKEI